MKRLRGLLGAARLSLALLLGRRLGMFATIDALVVALSLFFMLLSGEGDTIAAYPFLFLFPTLILSLPAMAGMVDLERRAGCLDLALSAPAAEGYFVRRAGAVCGFAAVQGAVLVFLGWLAAGRVFPLLAGLIQIAVVCAFLGAVSLFWAVRLRTAGAVWLASAVTVGLMGRWFFFDPTTWIAGTAERPLLPWGQEALDWLPSLAVLSLATVLFYLYARRRLRRPELMLS